MLPALLRSTRTLFCSLALFFGAAALGAQSDNGGLRVFLDCDSCDQGFVRQEVVYVDWVRDQHVAQVHVLVTDRAAGAGREFQLEFLGKEDFAGLDQSLTYTSSRTDTSDERRRGLARMLQLGLVPYVMQTAAAEGLEIAWVAPRQEVRASGDPAADPWNFWVYNSGANASFSGEDRRDAQSVNGWFGASRTTEAWRMGYGVNSNYSESTYELDDGEIVNTVQSGVNVNGTLIKSLGEHWGVGGGGSVRRSTFLNLDDSYRIAAALEYNLFPYSQSSQRELTFTYFLGLMDLNYEETTLLGELEDQVVDHGVVVSFDFDRPWGESGLAFEASTFVDDFDKHRFELRGRVRYRIFRGFAIDVSGNATLLRDQIYLPAGEASDEDVLLGTRALETNERFRVNFGFSYTFGSIYNSIVNTRLTGTSGGFARIF